MLAVVAIDIHLMPNWTIIVQLGIFLLAAVVLNLFVFNPLLKIFDMRGKYTSEAEMKERLLTGKAEKLEESRTNALKEALGEAQCERAKRIEESRIEGERIVEDARRDARKLMDETELSIESTEKSIFDEMNIQAKKIADTIVSEIVEGDI